MRRESVQCVQEGRKEGGDGHTCAIRVAAQIAAHRAVRARRPVGRQITLRDGGGAARNRATGARERAGFEMRFGVE